MHIVDSIVVGALETPMLAALDNTPEDDEPVSPEEAEQVRRGIQEAAREEVIPNASVWQRHA